MNKPTCVELNCHEPVRSRHRCTRHYNRWIRDTPPADRPMPTNAERFALYVQRDESGCLIWTAGGDKLGYGRFWWDGSIGLATRFALEQRLGRAIRPGYFACHTCDTPPCVEAAHLYEGTHQENVDDMTSQLRQAWGERNGRHKLTLDEVKGIQLLATQGRSQSSIARQFRVHQSTISRVVAGLRWAPAHQP